MTDRVKYLVEVRCQPLPPEQAAGLAVAVGRSFAVGEWRFAAEGLTVELAAAQPLAYGALKDLADLLERELAERGARLESGVVRQAAAESPARAAVNALARWLGRPRGFRGRPVMYFHWGLELDLALNGRLSRGGRPALAGDLG